MDKETVSTRRAVLGGIATLGIGGGVIYGASTLGSDSSGPTIPVEMHATTGTEAIGVELDGHPIMGSLDAPIGMYYWSDYQCPFCARFETKTFPDIIRNYVHAGDIRVIFTEYPYIGKDSMTAAVMDQCVWRQVTGANPDAYWRWHSAVFDAQGAENSGWASKENLLDITRSVDGISATKVNQCMNANRKEIEDKIGEHIWHARELGLAGSPAFIFYNREAERGRRLIGAQPYEIFKKVIRMVKNADGNRELPQN